MTPSRRRQWAVALMFVTPAFWSVNYVVARSASHTIAPHMLALGRWLLAGALMAAMHRREIVRQPAAARAEAGRFLVLGALGMWICGAFVYVAGRTTTATNIGLIYAISPVLIALFSTLVLKERIAAAQITGTVTAIAGFLHIVCKGEWTGFATLQLTPGDWWIFVAAISWAAYTILLKAWPSAFGPGARLALISLGGALVTLPLAIAEALWFMPSQLSWQNAGYIATTAIVPGIGAYLAYSFMLRELGASRVAVVLYLGPIYGALMGWLVLGEKIRAFHWAGAALILPGIFLATRRGKS